MNPFFFGAAPRRLFGIYHPARSAPGEGRAAVFCYPWGSEYLHAHRALRQLAKMLAAEGVHSLRFDYFGTGDSAGETTDADLKGWRTDIESAIDELMHAAGCPRVTLIGFRLGGTLAAEVAARHIDKIDTMVLWDPVVSGAEYLEDLWLASTRMPRVNRLPPPRPAHLGGGHEFLGFPLTAAMEDEIKTLSLTRLLTEFPARTLILVSQVQPSLVSLKEIAASVNSEKIVIEALPDLNPWIERDTANAGAVPAKVLKRIARWFT
jgi:exosortase A-associated hydrolase 2